MPENGQKRPNPWNKKLKACQKISKNYKKNMLRNPGQSLASTLFLSLVSEQMRLSSSLLSEILGGHGFLTVFRNRQTRKLDEMYDQLRSEYESMKRSAIQAASKIFPGT